jgi:hypothetical protein
MLKIQFAEIRMKMRVEGFDEPQNRSVRLAERRSASDATLVGIDQALNL